LCATALGAAIQKTPRPPPVPFHFPPSDPEQMPRPPMNGFMAFAALLGVMIFLPIAFIITFGAVCSVTTALSANYDSTGCLGLVLGIVAAALLMVIIIVAFSRFKMH
jgi:hypothetical protein